MGQKYSQLWQESNDYGECYQQTFDRLKVENVCQRVEAATYDDYGGNLTIEEKLRLDRYKERCESFKTYQAEIKKEMDARRKCNYKDTKYFGYKYLSGVFNDSNIGCSWRGYHKPYELPPPIVEEEEQFRQSITERRKGQMYQEMMNKA